MANVAQLINTIHSLFIAHEDKFGGDAELPRVRDTRRTRARSRYARRSRRRRSRIRDGRRALWGLSGSASLREKTLTVTVVIPHATEARECAIDLRGASVCEDASVSPTDSAHNSFEHPAALAPRDATVNVRSGSLMHTFPAASVTKLQLDLM